MNQTPFHKAAMPTNIINHFILIVDESWSMNHLRAAVVRVFDQFIARLAASSKEKDQETRITVYFFNSYGTQKCIIYDKDVLRVPSLEGLYHPDGNTALIQTFQVAMSDLRQIPTKYGDHSFVVFGWTDGDENDSYFPRTHANQDRVISEWSRALATAPENETYGLFVPDQKGVARAERFGFPRSNVSVWDSTSVRGIEEAALFMGDVAESYMAARAQGVRGYSVQSGGGLFRVRNFTADEVVSKLTPLPLGSYVVLSVPGSPRDSVELRPFIQSHGLTWVKGENFYQPTKAVKLQDYKRVIIEYQGLYYTGTGDEARQLLGLPDHDVTVNPGHKQGMTVFFESDSVNRKLFGGTRLVVRL